MTRALRWIGRGLFAIIACGCGAESPESQLPEALRDQPDGAEVAPFSGWTAEGIELYTVSTSMPDMSSTTVVGVDAAGEMLRDVTLMRRLGEHPPEALAQRVLGVLMHRAHGSVLTPDSDEAARFPNVWSAVTAPRIEDGVLIFYTIEGEMNPDVFRNDVVLGRFSRSSMSAAEELRQRGEVVPRGDGVCHPVVDCGCWSGCARLVPVLTPEGVEGTHVRVRRPTHAAAGEGEMYAREERCLNGVCFQTCRADTPTAHCDVGAFAAVGQACSEACPPSEAPFHCETRADSCTVVQHPSRAAD